MASHERTTIPQFARLQFAPDCPTSINTALASGVTHLPLVFRDETPGHPTGSTVSLSVSPSTEGVSIVHLSLNSIFPQLGPQDLLRLVLFSGQDTTMVSDVSLLDDPDQSVFLAAIPQAFPPLGKFQRWASSGDGVGYLEISLSDDALVVRNLVVDPQTANQMGFANTELRPPATCQPITFVLQEQTTAMSDLHTLAQLRKYLEGPIGQEPRFERDEDGFRHALLSRALSALIPPIKGNRISVVFRDYTNLLINFLPKSLADYLRRTSTKIQPSVNIGLALDDQNQLTATATITVLDFKETIQIPVAEAACLIGNLEPVAVTPARTPQVTPSQPLEVTIFHGQSLTQPILTQGRNQPATEHHGNRGKKDKQRQRDYKSADKVHKRH